MVPHTIESYIYAVAAVAVSFGGNPVLSSKILTLSSITSPAIGFGVIAYNVR